MRKQFGRRVVLMMSVAIVSALALGATGTDLPVGITASAQSKRNVVAQSKILLKRRYKEGSVISHSTSTEVRTFDEDGGTDTDSESGIERTLVKSVARDGTVILAKRTEENSGGLLDVMLSGPSFLVTISGSGHLLDVKATAEGGERIVPLGGDYFLKEQLWEVLMPSKAVSVGESWISTLDNKVHAGEKIVLRTTLVGCEMENDQKFLMIKQTGVFTDGNSKINIYRGRFWLDPVTHLTLESLITINNSDGQIMRFSRPVTHTPEEKSESPSDVVVLVDPVDRRRPVPCS